MRHLSFGIPILGSIALLLGVTGCADENPWGNTSKEKGSISLTLSTDSGIKTAKPVFRSDENGADTPDPNNLNTYIDVPAPEDFSIRLEKSTGEVSSWNTFADFKEHIASNQFDTGTYTLTAYSGEQGKQDFEAPYFEASTTFNVLSDQNNEINLTAELKNSMIKINYTEAFKNYMKDYYAKIRTEGVGEPVTFGALETRPLFVEPKNANLTLYFTTKGTGRTTDVSIGDFPPLAKTLHNITFDIDENASLTSEATLKVTFDETLEEESISIDLTDQLLTTPAPVITCSGFTDGQTIDLLDLGENVPELKMTARASDKITSALLTIESENYTPSWGNEIDLCKATQDQQTAIKIAGIKATGFGFEGSSTDLMAILELTGFCKSTLPTGNHKVSLVVKDSKGKVSETAAIILDNQEITLTRIDNHSVAYGAESCELTFEFNGTNPLDNLQFSIDNGISFKASSCIEQTATRASETKTYVFTLPLNKPIKPNFNISAYYKVTKNLGEFPVTVSIPEYNIEYDAFSRYAYARITTPGSDNSVRSAVTQNIQLKNLDIINRDPSTGIITIVGPSKSALSQATKYSVIASITGEEPTVDKGSFTTENATEIPNGNFSQVSQTINISSINTGGQYTGTRLNNPKYQLKSSVLVNEATDWESVNALTCNESKSTNKNTWYCVPSTWVKDGIVTIRSVGYSHGGSDLGFTNETAVYYCKNAASFKDSEKVSGELILNDYSFVSRPSSISFEYMYSGMSGEKGCAEITLKAADGSAIQKSYLELEPKDAMYSIAFDIDNYVPFESKKADKINIRFKSTSTGTPAINIPSGTALKEESINVGNFTDPPTIPTNEYKAVATGSILKIANVKAIYNAPGVTPATAPKRKTTKRK